MRGHIGTAVGWNFLLTFAVTVHAADDSLMESGESHLVITTTQGVITIELFEEAAPQTIRKLVQLVKGPVFNADVVGNSDAVSSIGYYDGLTFNYTNPRIEIVTADRLPDGVVQFENEISAEALGLNRQFVDNAGKAMDVMQMELLPAHQAGRKSGTTRAELGEWMKKWYVDYKADFLVGTSREEVNEALGYVYNKGLESRPVVRGAVALKPASPGRSTARLSIILTDIPERNGRWVVIGRVVDGLELADAISVRPRIPGRYGDRWFLPLVPVKIDSIRFECRVEKQSRGEDK